MHIANSLAFLLYLSCSVILIRNFVNSGQQNLPSLSAGMIALLALICHGIDIFLTMHVTTGGWNLGLFTTLSIASWLMAFIAFVIGLKIVIAHPGIIIYPLVALSLVFKALLPSNQMFTLSNPATEWHILISLAAYSLLTLAALQAIVLAIQERQLRKQQHFLLLLQKLPPLQSMETVLFQLITVGFVLLTIGLTTGIVFVDDLFAQHLVHKSVLSVIAWCVFAYVLWGRRRYGWRGKTAVKWTLIGFSFLALAYLGSKLVLEFLIK